MIQHSGALLVALKSLLIAEIFNPRWRIAPPTASSMPAPFQSTAPQVIKIEDEGNSASFSQGLSEQELMDMFRRGVQRRLDLRKKQGQYNTSGSANPPPVQQLPPPPPLSSPPPHPPSPAAEPAWTKRLPTEPPPGLAGIRQPPQKQHQRKPPWQRAQQSSQPAQNAHRTPGPPGPPPVNVQPTQHAPQPAQNAHCSGGPPPVNAGSVVPPPASSGGLALVVPMSSAGKPPHPASKRKPTVACGVCGVLCMTTWHLKDHDQGRKHRNKVACLAGQMNVLCRVCNVYLSGALNVEQHYAGKQHRWRLSGGA